MRIRISKQLALGGFLAVMVGLWMAIASPQWRIFPLIDEQGVASGLWALRQQALYLSGFLSIGLMSLCMVLALRRPWMERPLGGMDQVYRLHKWAGIGAGVMAIAHWLAKESSGVIKDAWGTAGRPARELVWAWAGALRGTAKDVGEIAFYVLLALLVLTLWQQLLNYRRWRWTHRVMPLIYLALVAHSVVLMPERFWFEPLGMLFAVMFAAGSVAALISLASRIGESRTHDARIERVNLLGESGPTQPIELVCAVPQQWRKHEAGQFAFLTFDRVEGAHPFTIASAPQSLGKSADGEELLRFVIKPLGDWTSALAAQLQAGQHVRIEGPYGGFDAVGDAGRKQIWVAGGVGITPFMALLEARQPSAEEASAGQHAVQMHYCTRDAASDALLAQVQRLCDQAIPPVQLVVHDAARGDYFSAEALEPHAERALDIWFCGPTGLGSVLSAACRRLGAGQWRLHRELFAMR